MSFRILILALFAAACVLVLELGVTHRPATKVTALANPLLVWDKLTSNGSPADQAMVRVYAAATIADQAKSIDVVQSLVDQGDARAAFRLGRFFQRECAQHDYARALNLYRIAAAKGDGSANSEVGTMYLYGEAVPRDASKAFIYFTDASAEGSIYGADNVALAIISGRGVEQDRERGLAMLQANADRNSPSSINLLASIYQSGSFGVRKDERRGFDLYQRAAALGDVKSEVMVGESYIAGWGVARDGNRGLKILQSLSDAGSPGATNFIAYLYCCGSYGFVAEPAHGFALHELAAAQGSEDSAERVGSMMIWGDGTANNLSDGLALLKRLSDEGNGGAADRIGSIYHEAEYVSADDAVAVKYWTRGAELGNCLAMRHLADAYAHAWAVTRDDMRSTQFTLDAVQCSNPPAGFDAWRLGTRYRDGTGIAKDCGKAAYWFKASAESGDVGGMVDLGFFYEKGCESTPDLASAFHWYLMAAKHGSEVGQNDVGAMLKHGKGVDHVDLTKAYAWLTVAKLNGSEMAARNLTEFATLFSDADRLKGLAYVPTITSKIAAAETSDEQPDDSY